MASQSLQATHDDAVQTRTHLRLRTEAEEQEQKLQEFKLKREKERTKLSKLVMGLGVFFCITLYGKFGGLVVYVTTVKLKSTKISYSHIYVWRSCTELPNLNLLIFLQ